MRNGKHALNTSLQWEGTRMGLNVGEARTPRPTPQFFNERQTFSTKKERGETPRDHQPPKPPMKSAPPISRIFAHKPQLRAQAVSFKHADNSLLSAHYKEDSRQLYFDQCFVFEEKIGVGSFGEVFKVRSREDGRYYAVKRSRERFRGESDRRRKLEEVAKHEQLPKQANCVGFVKAWEERQHLYIQTELCESSLQHVAASQHSLPETLIWNYLVDLLMAVKHLHDHDLVHMDIKPDNILISHHNTCKIGDFGLMIDLTKGINVGEAQEGDPMYLAPELMQGKFGKAADVFSLGVSIFELATDLDLPRGGDLWHVLRSGQLPEEFLYGVSQELKEVIRWMMEPDPDVRPTPHQILQQSFVKQIWKRRRREQVRQCVTEFGRMLMRMFYMFFLTLWHVLIWPLQNAVTTPTESPQRTTAAFHPTEWDYSFSEDEAFDDDEINISNNSMGVPLNYSTSSDESFAVPTLPVRNVRTTPGFRLRSLRTTTPHAAPSPFIMSSASSRFSSSPLTNSCRRTPLITPDNSLIEKPQEEEVLKVGIEPKNLMDAFEGASSDDD